MQSTRSRGWVRRMLPFLRRKPGNLLLAFVGVFVAGMLAAVLLVIQRLVLDLAIHDHLDLILGWPLGMLVVLGVLGYFTLRSAAYRELKAGNDVQFQVYEAVHRRMLEIDADSQALPPGQLAARLNSDIHMMSRAVASLPKQLGVVITTAGTVVLMLTLHPLLGVVTLMVIPLLLVVAWRSRRKVRPATWDAQQKEADVAQRASMAIAGIRVVKALGQDRREVERMATASGALYGSRMRLIRIQSLFQPLLDAISGLAQALVVLVGGWLILQGDITLGTFLAFSVYNAQLVVTMKWFAETVVVMQEAGVCATRVFDLLDLPPAVVDSPTAQPLLDVRGDVELDRVRFGYGDGSEVLDDVSLRVDAGETVALVGMAGSGKSTVVKLLARFQDPTSGAVRLDGIDLRRVSLESLHRQVGVVFDDPMLFTGTIRENIRYGRPDASDDAVVEAAATAGAHDFIIGLPDGYETAVGERGYTLSGGQRQRIALARTLLTDPRVLVLDDPTAGVDPELEREIHRRIRDRGGRRTTIVVGYRPSTVAVADRIVVMDAGRIVDDGRHEELLERCSLYRRLVDPDAARAAAAERAPVPIRAVRHSAPAAPARPTTDDRMREAAATLPPVRDTAPIRLDDDGDITFSVFAMLRPYRWAFAIVLSVVGLQTAFGVLSPYITRHAVDGGILAGSMTGLIGAAAGIVAMSVLGLVLTPLMMVLAGRVGQRVVHTLRMRTWIRLIKLPIAYHERQKVGRVLTRVINDIEGFSQFATIGLVGAVVSGLTILGVLGAMLAVQPLLAGLVALVMLPFVAVLRRYNKKIAAAYLAAREQVGEANAALQENLAGIREAQAFNQQERQHAEYREAIRRHLDFRLTAERLIAASYPVVSFLSGLALAVVLGVGAVMLARHSLSAGELIAFVLWSTIFFPPIVQLGIFFSSDVKRVEVSTILIRELMAEDLGPQPPAVPVRPGRIRGELRLEGVRFRYPKAGGEVLRGVDLVVPAGGTVALVGATGAGKSTIFKMLSRFYDPTEGRVLVDGIDLRTLDLDAFRSRLGYLPQEAYLFGGTIRDNIAYGRPDATDAEVEAAARAVGAHEGIRALPDGYQHMVGERGGAVSAGLRQLVCLARAYLVDPAIVLLDEATAKLDLATEARVLAAIRTVTRGRTTLMIAHRLQTAMVADRILVISDGEIVESGTHTELLTADGRYAALYEASVLAPTPA